jgi:hypothetical protein
VDEISFYRLKAERCARLAKDEADTGRRLELENEGTLWLELADAEEHLDELRKKVQNHLNAHRLNEVAGCSRALPSRQGTGFRRSGSAAAFHPKQIMRSARSARVRPPAHATPHGRPRHEPTFDVRLFGRRTELPEMQHS